METGEPVESAPPAPSQEDEKLPLVEVTITDAGSGVLLKWGRGVAHEIAGSANDFYTESPFSIQAVDANGYEPFIKIFRSISRCHGGVLTLSDKRCFRIKVEMPSQRERPHGKLRLLASQLVLTYSTKHSV